MRITFSVVKKKGTVIVFKYTLCFLLLLIPLVLFAGTHQSSRVATVKTSDGATYELTDAEFLTGTSGNMYTIWPNYSSEGLLIQMPSSGPSFGPYLKVHVPIDALQEVVFNSTEKPIIVRLKNGTTLEGLVETFFAGDTALAAFLSRTQVEGYSAEIEISRHEINKIMFTKDKKGIVSAEVIKKDGSVKKDLMEPKFHYSKGDSRSAHIKAEKIKCKIEDATLEIPSADIVSIQRNDKGTSTLMLRNGKKISGDASFVISGKTSFQGMEATFKSGIDVREIVFK